MTELRNEILALWEAGERNQKLIAEELECSTAYVGRVLHGKDCDGKQVGPDLVYKPITPAEVVECYFAWPTYRPIDIARSWGANPDEVARICQEKRLPFRGHLWPEDRA